MAVQTYENINRLPPELEGLQKRLLNTGFGEFDGTTQTSAGLLDAPLNLPDYQIAGMDPLRSDAISMGEDMMGSYQPFIQGAANQSMAAQQALTSGLGYLQPDAINQFMNPYQQNVIDATMAELNRQDGLQRQKDANAAVQSGAFGGSREGVQRAETSRNLQQVKSDTLSKMIANNYAQAQKAAQEAGRLSGGIGQAYGTLAGTTSDIGRLQQALGQADVSQLSQLGGMRQSQEQAQLDAARQNEMQNTQDPFTRLQIGQNLLAGSPSAGIPSTFAQTVTPQANPFIQGYGMATTIQNVNPFSGGSSSSGGR